MRKRPILAVAAVAIPVVIVSVLLGFKTQQPFLSNLLAGVACIGLGAMVGVFLVDRFVQYDRRAQWARSRNYVLSGIASHLSDAATDLFIFMPISDHRPMGLIIEGRSRPNPLTIEGFREVARQLKSVKRSPSPDKHLSDYAIEFYEHAKWDLDQIQSVLTPRVIQSEVEQELIDALMFFDEARRNLYSGIISHKLVVTDAAFLALVNLVEASADLYAVLCKHWRPSPKK